MLLSDDEAIEIITKIKKGNYDSEAEEQRAFEKLFGTYPIILDLMKSNLPPERILEEAKKVNKAILL
jgi:hypothetical protein